MSFPQIRSKRFNNVLATPPAAPVVGELKFFMGVAYASIKKVSSVASASIKKIAGILNS